MEHILFAAAEQQELDRAQAAFRRVKKEMEYDVQVDFLLTGIGAVSTAYRLTRKIWNARSLGFPYTLVIDLGIAGSYDLERFPTGSAAVVQNEYFGDLGFDTSEGFKTLFECYCVDSDEVPYQKGVLSRSPLPQKKLEALLRSWLPATGITIQTITHEPEKVSALKEKFRGDVESMEGAAFYYVAISEKIPFFELRTISNVVGESDSRKWETRKALDCLEQCCDEILLSLIEEHR